MRRKRLSLTSRSLGKGFVTHSRWERIYAHEIFLLAEKLYNEFDLSPATAKSLSAGIPYFRGLTPFEKVGRCHTGGAKRAGKVAVDRYTAYRLKDMRFTLSVVQHFRDPENTFRFIVEAPKHLLPVPEPLNKLREVVRPRSERFLNAFGMRFQDFQQAARLYEKLIRKHAPKKKKPKK